MSDLGTVLGKDLAREELVAALRALRPVFAREGVAHMALFGSRARKDNRGDSDVDLVIEVAEGRKFSLLDLVGVGHTVEDNIGLPANIFIRHGLDREFLAEVDRDQIEIF